MKKVLFTIIILFCFTSCKLFQTGQQNTQLQNAISSIESTEKKINANDTKKLEKIGELSYGTNYTFSAIKSDIAFEAFPQNVKYLINTGNDLNLGIMSLTPQPSLEKMKEMEETIKKLSSNVEIERKTGNENIKKIQDEIGVINAEKNNLKIELQKNQEKLTSVAKELGTKVSKLESDNKNLSTELEKFDDGFGWYSIKHGFYIFAKKMFWIVSGFGIAFLLLKIFAASNPIASSIFSVFESFVGMCIKGIVSIFPNSTSFSGHVSKKEFDLVESSRNKFIDTLQTLVEVEKRSPEKTFTLKELVDELEKSMNDSDKAEVDRALARLGWKHGTKS